MDGRLVSAEDQTSIITALKGFLSSYEDKRYNAVLEKISSIFPGKQSRHIILDFGASGENSEVQAKLKILEQTIQNKSIVRISYVYALGEHQAA